MLKYLALLAAIAGVIACVKVVGKSAERPPEKPPTVQPSRSPYPVSVAATGIIEAARENVAVATSKPGLVTRVHVQVGSRVKSGDPLFQLDDREARARAASLETQITVGRASLAAEKVLLENAESEAQRATTLAKTGAGSTADAENKGFLKQNWAARCAKIEADIAASESALAEARTIIDVLTVKSPRDGTILRLSLREGEYAAVNPPEPLMVLGDIDTLQVRADVDEQNAPLITTNAPATAYLKGYTQDPLPLTFLRIDPYVVPKKSLTGESTERVDTRVLQVIFQLPQRPGKPLYVGQQVDLYIERKPDPKDAVVP